MQEDLQRQRGASVKCGTSINKTLRPPCGKVARRAVSQGRRRALDARQTTRAQFDHGATRGDGKLGCPGCTQVRRQDYAYAAAAGRCAQWQGAGEGSVGCAIYLLICGCALLYFTICSFFESIGAFLGRRSFFFSVPSGVPLNEITEPECHHKTHDLITRSVTMIHDTAV